MKGLNEYKAEIFRRSESRIKERRRNRNRVLALCIPLCLILVLIPAAVLPAFTPDSSPDGFTSMTPKNRDQTEHTSRAADRSRVDR